MKLERISENEIHCILESADLQMRNIHPSDLSYGSEKAKALFKEMLQLAGYELDFYAQNIPLMIETIPLQNDRIILIITRVEEADELDTRFARFAPSQMDMLDFDEENDFMEEDELDLFPPQPESPLKTATNEISKLFPFSSLEDASLASRAIANFYQGSSSLYHDKHNKCYFLSLHTSNVDTFERISNLMAEYSCIHPRIPSEAYCQEHLQTIIEANAINQLANL